MVILILAVSVTTALQNTWLAMRLVTQAHNSLLAVKGVQEYQLEWLRSVSFDDPAFLDVRTHISPDDFLTPALDPNSGVEQLPGGWAQYTVQLEGADPDLKKVTMEVRWTDPDGRQRSSVLSTLISRDGLTN